MKISSVSRCGKQANRLVLSVMMACALRAVEITCRGSEVLPSLPMALTLTRWPP